MINKNSFSESKKSISTFLILFNVLLSLVVISLLVLSFRNNDKIAYVESGKLLNEYKGSEKARKEFQKKATEWQANIDTLETEVKNAMKKYEKDLPGMTAREQKMGRELINTKRSALVNYQRAISENAKQENAKLMQGVFSTINSFLTEYGKKNGYKMIFIANESGTIAYAREGLDLTSRVLQELNDEYLTSKK
ncbi:OmpH family outer membrane protein [Pararcticibacter amylolyticus]|uniref:Molecular chaperone Skp n=1 Tax=Pararcticibacter amylolyticus TaxID=2173175 RepID=A0A2U2PJA2_9SPHI|nr:OmpH family outer membrane protein [Pararcticibacter amylolyticus]PWG81344.1 hypothetical protein DDR33_08225 [Pararcticibacter amylolyticus]